MERVKESWRVKDDIRLSGHIRLKLNSVVK